MRARRADGSSRSRLPPCARRFAQGYRHGDSETQPERGATEPRFNHGGNIATALLRGRCDARNQPAAGPLDCDRIADREDFRMSRDGEIVLNDYTVASIGGDT